MAATFRILEHTADVGFEAFGRTREEAFAQAACALMYLITDTDALAATQTTEIRVAASTPPDLLVNWLSEVLYLHETERLLLRDFRVHHLTDQSLTATAYGEQYDATRHRIRLQVKAITYHQLALEPLADGWRAQVYVDI
jgi:SHS2 domain-containing protein